MSTPRNLLQIVQGSKAYHTKLLFEGATLSVNEGEHIGVIGPNGAGKTTLFKIIAGQETLDGGQFIQSKALRMAYLKQDSQWDIGQTLRGLLETLDRPVWESEAHAQKIGVDLELFDRPLSELSGGYRMRCQLIYLFAQDPNLMLLDEPTNYLDLETLLILEKFLQSYEGAFLLISHDREFLKRTCHYTLEVEAGETTKYNGNIEDYFEQKTLLREQLMQTSLNQAKKRAQIEEFVNRFRAKATKAKQAQSRLKTLNKMETISIKPLPVTAQITIPTPLRTPRVLFELESVSLGYGDRTVLSDLNLIIERGQHYGVVGFNGAGKSTLLKSLAGLLQEQKGVVRRAAEVRMSYFGQHVHEQLDANLTVFEELQSGAHPDVSQQQVLDMAGALLFAGEDVKKSIGPLSGGEKMRVALGKTLLAKASLLILDEPTNHLDFQTVEALTHALAQFDGALIVVSHDRSFIASVGKKILEVRDGSVSLYPGSYEEYVWSLEKGFLSDMTTSEASQELSQKPEDFRVRTGGRAESGAGNADFKILKKRARELQRDIQKVESKMQKLDEQLQELNDQLVAAPPQESLKLLSGLESVQRQREDSEALWMSLQEELEQIENQLPS